MGDLISIIIPCYNAEKTIGKCISSLLNQTYNNLEIIVINDGSTDKTGDKLQHISDKDDRITILDQVNSGISSARNSGMKVAKGDFYSFVDADDYVEPDYLSKLFSNISGADLALCRYSSQTGSTNCHHNVITVEDVFREMMVPQENIAAFVWNRLYRASIIRDHKMIFNEAVYACEDTLFNFQYMQYVRKVGVCGEILYHYVINDSSTMFRKSFNEKKITANIAFKYMLRNSREKKYRRWVEVAAMWYNLILKKQIFGSQYIATSKEMETINKMLSLDSRAFMAAPIPIKYKLAYPIWRIR